ncbi:MAG: glycosyltransferase family 4 protein [Gammaproteobacteria bacterium]
MSTKQIRSRVICVMGRPLDQEDGIGVYTLQLLRNMLQLDPASRYVILLRTPKHAATFQSYPNAETRVIPARVKLWWDQISVARAARSVGADIIFNPKFSIPFLSMRPSVFVLHGSDWYVNPGNYTWWDNLYIRVMLPLYCRKAAKLLSISDIALADMVKYANIDATKVTPSYAAPGPHFRPINDRTALQAFAQRHHLPERFILTVARAYHTGHGGVLEYPGGNNENLIGGYRRYRAAGGRLPLVVVGRDIDAYLHRRGFDDTALEGVYFTGFIPNEEIVHAYNLADFFILCTLYESFPLPVTETMACGCPAILPTTGGCRGVAQEAARYIDPHDVDDIGNAMTELAGSEDLRSRMRDAGLRRIQEFTWAKTAERTLGVFDSLASRAG